MKTFLAAFIFSIFFSSTILLADTNPDFKVRTIRGNEARLMYELDLEKVKEIFLREWEPMSKQNVYKRYYKRSEAVVCQKDERYIKNEGSLGFYGNEYICVFFQAMVNGIPTALPLSDDTVKKILEAL